MELAAASARGAERVAGAQGPVNDTGATLTVVSARDRNMALISKLEQPVRVDTAGKQQLITEGASLPQYGVFMEDGVLMPGPDSLVPTHLVCEKHGLGFQVDEGNTAARYTKAGKSVLELVREEGGVRFRLPLVLPAGFESQRRPVWMAALAVQRLPSRMKMHNKRCHLPHDPKCDHCRRARLRDRMAKRIRWEDREDEEHFHVSSDYAGPMVDRSSRGTDGKAVEQQSKWKSSELSGNFWNQVLMDYSTGWTEVYAQKRRTADEGLEQYKEFVRELKVRCSNKEKTVISFYHDFDKAYEGEYYRYVREQGVKDSHTGGRRPVSNSLVERHIGLLAEAAKAALLTATGGHYYYDQLEFVALKRAAWSVNRVDWSDRPSPYMRLTGEQYSDFVHDH